MFALSRETLVIPKPTGVAYGNLRLVPFGISDLAVDTGTRLSIALHNLNLQYDTI